jgi:hypothetical protein
MWCDQCCETSRCNGDVGLTSSISRKKYILLVVCRYKCQVKTEDRKIDPELKFVWLSSLDPYLPEYVTIQHSTQHHFRI